MATIISGTLILKGDLICFDKILLKKMGKLIPISNKIADNVYSCPIKSSSFENGKSPTVTSIYSFIDVAGVINGQGHGFEPNFGPGANSTLLDNHQHVIPNYGATHAGIGHVNNIPGTIDVIFEEFNISEPEFQKKQVQLAYSSIDSNQVTIDVNGISSYSYGSDYYIQDSQLIWRTPTLEPIVTVGTIIKIMYLTDTTRIFPSPKPLYGSFEAPTSIGSGSGSVSGGSGIKLVSRSKYVNITGRINVNGGNASDGVSGGGSGGSAWVYSFNVKGDGDIKAQGGSADNVYAGGGGGGYITINYENENNFNGQLSSEGKRGGSNGVVFVRKIEPFFIEKFSGKILNSKWWKIEQAPIKINDALIMRKKAKLESLFSLSGKNIIIDIDLKKVGPNSHESYFKLLIDSDNWISISRKANKIYWGFSINGNNNSGSELFPIGSTTFRIIKRGPIFDFQYIGWISPYPVTIRSKNIPEFDSGKFKILIGVDSTLLSGVYSKWGNLKIFEGILHDIETQDHVLYVDSVNGLDSNKGSALAPLKNLSVATSWSKKGGTVVLYNGTYNNTEIIKKDLFLIGAYGKQQPVILASGKKNCLKFKDCQGLVHNISLQAQKTAILAQNTHNLEISMCNIHGSHSAIKFTEYTRTPKILGNTIHNNYHGIILDSQVVDPYIYSNVLYDMTRGIELLDASNFIISSNTLDSIKRGINLRNNSKGTVISNNITNIHVGVHGYRHSSVGLYNNNFYNTDQSFIGQGKVPVNQGNFSVSPDYFSPVYGDYHLRASSYDRSSGADCFDQYYRDRDGADRMRAPGYDVGAYTYVNQTHPAGQYFVDTSGNDFLNNGGVYSPFRTLDKAMSVANNSIQMHNSHYDSQFLKLKPRNAFLVDTTCVDGTYEAQLVTLHSNYNNIDLSKVIYVSPSGSDSSVFGGDGTDSGGNGSLLKPFRSLSRALSVSTSGNYIITLSGEYYVDGTFTGKDNIVISPVSDRTTTWDGSRMFVEDVFATPSQSYPNHVYPDSSTWDIKIG